MLTLLCMRHSSYKKIKLLLLPNLDPTLFNSFGHKIKDLKRCWKYSSDVLLMTSVGLRLRLYHLKALLI